MPVAFSVHNCFTTKENKHVAAYLHHEEIIYKALKILWIFPFYLILIKIILYCRLTLTHPCPLRGGEPNKINFCPEKLTLNIEH